jgi:hypothetical protein
MPLSPGDKLGSSPSALMELKPGDRLGDRYQLLSKLGEGGMGEVWKARDTELDRDVAVKVSKSEFTARFKQEARTIAAFNHENICQIYDVGLNYIVMELIYGVPLKGPLPVGDGGRLRGPDSGRPRCCPSQGFHASRSQARECDGCPEGRQQNSDQAAGLWSGKTEHSRTRPGR